MRGLSFVVAAIAAVQSSAQENGTADNAYYAVLPGYGAATPYGYGQPVVMADPYGPQYDPRYVQPSPYQPRYIEMPPQPYGYGVAADPVRYVEVPTAAPVVHEATHQKYVEVPEELYEKFMAETVAPVPVPVPAHHVTTVETEVTDHRSPKPIESPAVSHSTQLLEDIKRKEKE